MNLRNNNDDMSFVLLLFVLVLKNPKMVIFVTPYQK